MLNQTEENKDKVNHDLNIGKVDNLPDENEQELAEISTSYTLEEKLRYYSLPVVSILVILTIWFQLYFPFIIDDWNLGKLHVERSEQIKDPVQAENELEKGGAILRKQATIHPYHARVWHLLGCYYLVKGNFDSCIIAEKKAIDLGTGGIVNQVEFIAADNLNLALQKKLNLITNLDTSLIVIKNAELKDFDNFVIDKFKGMIFSKYKQPDSCIFYFKKYLINAPEDAYVLLKITENYIKLSDKKNAEFYLKKVEKLEKGNSRIDTLKNKISKIAH
jgi:tetratricopeptide (TPR) repeat protein